MTQTDPREAEYLEWRAEQLSHGLCPDSGEELTPYGDGVRGSLSCEFCDCFGYDPELVGNPPAPAYKYGLRKVLNAIAATIITTIVLALFWSFLFWLTTPKANGEPCQMFNTCQYQPPWNGQLIPTWDTPGYYGGFNNGPEWCSPFTLKCNGVAPGK